MVMSPNALVLVQPPDALVRPQTLTTHCRGCTQPVNEPWVCDMCYTVGHNMCLGFDMFRVSTFCGRCLPAARHMVAAHRNAALRKDVP